jgi:hypothetical protein
MQRYEKKWKVERGKRKVCCRQGPFFNLLAMTAELTADFAKLTFHFSLFTIH